MNHWLANIYPVIVVDITINLTFIKPSMKVRTKIKLFLKPFPYFSSFSLLTYLEHEFCDNSMELGALVAKAFLPSAQSPEYWPYKKEGLLHILNRVRKET